MLDIIAPGVNGAPVETAFQYKIIVELPIDGGIPLSTSITKFISSSPMPSRSAPHNQSQLSNQRLRGLNMHHVFMVIH